MFARAPQPPIFAPEGLSWEFPSRADRGPGPVSAPARLGGPPADSHQARLAPVARQAASAARGAVHGVAAVARELLLLADPELEARAAQLAHAGDSSGSRGGSDLHPPALTALLGEARHTARTHPSEPRRRTRRPGAPEASDTVSPCLTPVRRAR